MKYLIVLLLLFTACSEPSNTRVEEHEEVIWVVNKCDSSKVFVCNDDEIAIYGTSTRIHITTKDTNINLPAMDYEIIRTKRYSR